MLFVKLYLKVKPAETGGNCKTKLLSSRSLPALGARGSLSATFLALEGPSLFAGQVGKSVGSIGYGDSLKKTWLSASSALIRRSGS